MLATLDRTDELLLVCSLDVPTLKNVRLALGTLDMLSFPPARVRIVLNRANRKVGMKQREVEAALEQKVRYELLRPGRADHGQPRHAGCARRAGIGLLARST